MIKIDDDKNDNKDDDDYNIINEYQMNELLLLVNKFKTQQTQSIIIQQQIKHLTDLITNKHNNYISYSSILSSIETFNHIIQTLKRQCYTSQYDLLQHKNLLSSSTSKTSMFSSSIDNLSLYHSNLSSSNKQLSSKLFTNKLLLSKHQQESIRLLFTHIYPITTSPTSSSSSTNLLIRNLSLTSSSDETAAALGYIAHLVFLLSKYLNVPLRYPLTPKGSCSVIFDLMISHKRPLDVDLDTDDSFLRGLLGRLVKQTNDGLGLDEFPLYLKGVDRSRFDYAVFLLNKNIEQVMNTICLPITDLRNTLKNLHSISIYLL